MDSPSDPSGVIGDFVRSLPAVQQPDWSEAGQLAHVTDELSHMPALVTWDEVRTLRSLLAEVAAGKVQVIQSGDCAEDPAECCLGYVARKAALLDVLAGVMKINSLRPVIRVGRIAGQFGKPRSKPTELVDGRELPVFRGHMVNSPEPDPELRIPLPERLLVGYRAARTAVDILRHRTVVGAPIAEAPIWTSHEALLLDYELPLLRRLPDGAGVLLSSTHWPWIGDRTRQLDGAHVALLASVANPVASKVGPGMAVEELLALCARLDPHREPGRLTLISRMGADRVAGALPPLVAAVREAGHPVSWLCDPMHGNTVTAPSGLKTRLVDTVIREVERFQDAVDRAGGVAGGLHLETTPDDVTECAAHAGRVDEVPGKYTSFCDPRLNPEQAIAVASAWRS
ncbi:3-deoxy-7-phosphoheptulonate synthase [Kitasatospora sp. NPDC006697]|uniref:3-deoxy-7-phosphoheptulonate synthase n=1 Tax=Kitasatospora sp. NPDC006697 TaxID=3364020 RepID=UPI0036748132